jgi:hypothetical protein
MRVAAAALFVQFLVISAVLCAAAPKADPPLVTRWAAMVAEDNSWPEYPRPQLQRADWLNLNGRWDLAVLRADDPRPAAYNKRILVPFPVESFLSGLSARVSPNERVWYRRSFELPSAWKGRRVMLHFGAVDWEAVAWVNGTEVGQHRGGYDPFSFDVTAELKWEAPNELVVAVRDPTDQGDQPHGKQALVPEGIRYTPTTGIWQTVWLEPVPTASVDRIKVIPQAQSKSVRLEFAGTNLDDSHQIEVEISQSGAVAGRGKTAPGKPLTISLANGQLWTPDRPFLYDLQVRLKKDGAMLDEVTSYFGLRSIALGKDKNGLTRIMLNGEPLFHLGVLDQGYWPDGLYTPPSDDAVRHDLETAKRLGFNMIRKHVKVEPARWYYWCDRLGLLVWQDMPSGDEKGLWPLDGTEITRSEESAQQFKSELKCMVDFAHNFPSIVVWVPFNEAWGQFETKQIAAWLKEYDPTRLVVAASGGNDFGAGDVDDDHFYPGPGAPPAEHSRAAALGEFGGLGLPLAGHTWSDEENWGYRTFSKPADLAVAYVDLVDKLRPLVESHLSAAVYTQLTDVEIEVNGLMTYDRAEIKVVPEAVSAANRALFKPLPRLSADRRFAAPTLAWWRFEDGEPGQLLANIEDNKGAIAVIDQSGHNNHLFAFSGQTAPRIGGRDYEDELANVVSENRNCLDDSASPPSGVPVRDLFTDPNLARTHMNVLNTYPFSEWTIEASFSLAKRDGSQVILSKQGSYAQSPYPPFQLGVFGAAQTIQVQMIDGLGKFRVVDSKIRAPVGQWRHVAAVCDGASIKLYVKEDARSEYELCGESSCEGALVNCAGVWAVGRGFADGRITFDALAHIDEVRISVTARPVRQFLFGD